MKSTLKHTNMVRNVLLMLLLTAIACACADTENKPVYEAPYATKAPIIDAQADEAIWQEAEWAPIDRNWVGENYTPADFTGRYKAVWNENRVFLLVRVTDDTLIDIHEEPLEAYWDDDCVEVFFDEDASGGNHQFNYNAFAYHVALDYNIADIHTDSTAILLNDHGTAKHLRKGKNSLWELSFRIYDDSFAPGQANKPVKLQKGKKIGFMIAYCDNDTSETRENFIGSVPIKGEDKNRGWIDAGVFGKMKLLAPAK